MIVAHLDLDAFFAAVEELEDPALREVPLVVGGDPRGRGVVATANYRAREFGIRSAMSCAEALRRCPHATFLRPRHSLYSQYSQAVWEVVRGATSLSCSLGVGTSKVVAKVASDRRKPGGITVVLPGREAGFLAPFDLRLLPGIGPRTEERLRARGLATLGALAALGDGALAALLPGKVGLVLRDRARGLDPRGLEPPTENISISHEETFARDVADREALHAELRRMADRLGEHLAGSGRAARTVTTKVRYPDFAIRSRSTSLAVGTDDGARIGELACALLDRALADRPGALRLVGVGISNLEPYRQLALPT